MKVRDRYDQEVERLTERPRDIWHSWCAAEPLFAVASGEDHRRQDGTYFGCLTQIRGNLGVCEKPSLTLEIRRDTRIPIEVGDIKPKHLKTFARWQRRLDKELKRTPPPLL